MRVNSRDLGAAIIFIAIAAFFAENAWRNLDMGTAFRMGPGYFPLVLAGILIALSIGILVRGVAVEEAPITTWPWRGMAFVLSAPIAFGLMIRGAGLMPTIFVVSFLTAMASVRMTWFMATWLSAGIALFCTAVFVWGLGLPIPIRGAWLGGY